MRTIAPAVILAAGLLACLEPRDRLDAPRVALTVDQDSVLANSELTGAVYAADATGVVYVSAEVFLDTSRTPHRRVIDNFLGADSVEFPFSLHIEAGTPVGTRLIVRGVAIDDQLFTVTVEDTAYVR